MVPAVRLNRRASHSKGHNADNTWSNITPTLGSKSLYTTWRSRGLSSGKHSSGLAWMQREASGIGLCGATTGHPKEMFEGKQELYTRSRNRGKT